MSTEGFQRFIQTAKRDWKLNDEFTAAVATLARKSGFDVNAADVRDFLDALPAERAEDTPAPGATTRALGEEDDKGRPSVTLAIGEEDKSRATTMAVGEEGRNRTEKLPPMTVTTMALGEEDKKGGDDLNQRDKDRAADFDSMYGDQPHATTMALGEEDKKPAPPAAPPKDDRGVTTLAMGEEGKKPRPPGPQ